MTRLPRVSSKDVIGALKKLGFRIIRTRGSHYIMEHADHRLTVVPYHGNETIGPGVLSHILVQAEISADEFRDAL